MNHLTYKNRNFPAFIRVLSVWVIVLFTVSLTGCGTGSGENPEGNLTLVTLKGPSSMGMVQLTDSLSREKNPTCHVVMVNEPLQARKLMLEGKADIVLLPMTMAAISYNKGLDYRLVAVPVWGALYLYGEDTTITRWEDLKGKTVHTMARGMTPDILFRYLLIGNGLDPDKDLTLDYRFPSHIDLASAMAMGKVKLGVISETQSSQVVQKNHNLSLLMDLNHEWTATTHTPMPQTAFLASASALEKYPKQIEKILAACERSTLWVNNYPDSAAVLLVRHKILDGTDVAVRAIPKAGLHFARADSIRTLVKDYLQVFYTLDPEIVGGKMPDEAFYH